jgi:hypothetical protein
MKAILSPLRSPAMIVACVALVVALGGVSYAAGVLPKNSVGTPQLKKKAVTGKKIAAKAVTSGKVKNGSLLGVDFADGQLPAGPKGDKGDKGEPGKPATRLWGRVDNGSTNAVLLDGSGIASVKRDPAFAGFQGIILVTFDRDVSHCSFQATPVLRGSGAANPTPGVAITTGFYAGSGTTERQIRVSTFLNGTRANVNFDFAAFC